jgi:hypothetical protein
MLETGSDAKKTSRLETTEDETSRDYLLHLSGPLLDEKDVMYTNNWIYYL